MSKWLAGHLRGEREKAWQAQDMKVLFEWEWWEIKTVEARSLQHKAEELLLLAFRGVEGWPGSNRSN